MGRISSRLLAGGLTCLMGLPCGAQAPLPEQERADEGSRCLSLPGILCSQVPTSGNKLPTEMEGAEEETHCALEGLTPPKPLSRPELRYTPEALEAHVHGVVLARCTLTPEGTVEGCLIIKSLPHMDQAIIEMLEHSRYSPITRDGKPIRARYTFTVRVTPP